ncbi:endonuclease/exonuclease/phosphatase family protein [Phyllobacterium myrsinacearum]|uniref:Endonuclease/exonuclease/phosphatase family metal-dependent hydrolase n=1 Tax=Phyllobacterium myrsinacearum TaxID=28101 RepID=A0A839ESQ5_9HYPH|nr:endonuclease/exonuclease/phosphatase family protein [Phyllobacterium myrsinacearum]MBA8879467.1 endonuclease/exonuclease/phosphatase family metal-dependent hydrolase [Phyllobacterium myrsinacearum]
MALRILSLNVWGGRLHGPLIQYLAGVDADVFCLQEVVHTPDARNDWLLYRDGNTELPQRAHLFDEICAALPEHAGYFCPTARGLLFDGEDKLHSEFGLATFVRKTHAVIGQAMDFVHGTFSPNGWGEHPRARNAHCVRIFSYEDGFSLTVAHMHGLRDITGKEDSSLRVEQARFLVRLIERVHRNDERLVVCGDFNVLPGSVTFEALARLGLSDLVTTGGHTDTRTSFYPKNGRFADYMLTTPHVKIRKFDVVAHPEVSDHRALVLDIA